MAKRTHREPKIFESIEITGIADKGKAVGRHEGQVVFVENAVPGDVCDVYVFKSRKGFHEGRIERLITPSADRTESFCAHFGTCGGCKWQHLSYEAQLKHKNQTVHDALIRIGKVAVGEWLPIVGSPETTFYRNKLEYTFSNKRWLNEAEHNSEKAGAADENYVSIQQGGLGFHKAGAFDKIIPIEKCYLQRDPSNQIRNAVRDFAKANGYTLYDPREHKGWMRTLFIRTTNATNETMVIVVFDATCPKEKREAMMAFVQNEFPEITALLYVVSGKMNDTIFDLDVHTWSGRNYIVEHLGESQYKISPKSFFQTNSAQAKTLYDITADFCDLKPTDNVYDLYTGTGSIACFIAKRVKSVVGIEEIDAAVLDAHENARMNGLDNVAFYTGDVKNILSPEFEAKHGKPDVVITDPPRAGMHTDVINYLLALAAPRLVYVSCNPATQARDLALLAEKYDVLKVQPVDMFPHTHHIENVAQLRLREV
jgi:23S rRNA (uracil1939-C5)-methyltransferase